MSQVELEKVFPNLCELSVPIYTEPVHYIKWEELKDQLSPIEWRIFGEYYGMQTQFTNGPYASDVEAVLERMKSGRLMGSQLEWD